MFKQLTSRPLWLNIVVGIGILVIIFLLFVFSLKKLTHHGESKTVPSITGKSIGEVQDILQGQGFELVVQDSVYYDTIPPATVIKQVPEADAVVKVNRTVYVTVNRTVPPDVEMPNLIGYTFRNAEMVLKNMGLRVGDTTSRPDLISGASSESMVSAV